MRDGPLRSSVKALALIRYYIDKGFWQAWYRLRWGRPTYEINGRCEPCGKCCEAPAMTVPRMLFRFPAVMQMFLAWQHRINQFEMIRSDAESATITFKCGHYDPVSKQCDSYYSRPGICRDYPRNLRYEVRPELFDECSFVLTNRLDRRLDIALENADLPPEKIAEIREKLARRG